MKLDNPKKGQRITDYIRSLVRYIRTLDLRGDGVTCRIERGADGGVLHVLPGGSSAGGSSTFLTPFWISWENNNLRISNAVDGSSQYAGVANVNGDLLPVPVGTVTAPTIGYVVLKATKSSSGVTFDFEVLTTPPTAVDGSGVGYAILGGVASLNGTLVIQNYQNSAPTIMIGGPCD